MTPYLAECINAITNLAYIFLAIRGYQQFGCKSECLAPFLSLFGVGVASGAFHGTLKFEAEVCDSTSMLIGAAIVLARIWTLRWNTARRALFNWILATFVTVAMAIFFRKSRLDVHAASFGILILLVCFKSVYLTEKIEMSAETRRARRRLALVGATTFVISYGCWLVDFHRCGMLQRFRAQVGLPWGIVSELHGWWHALSAVGVYCYICLVELLRLDYEYSKNRKITKESLNSGRNAVTQSSTLKVITEEI